MMLISTPCMRNKKHSAVPVTAPVLVLAVHLYAAHSRVAWWLYKFWQVLLTGRNIKCCGLNARYIYGSFFLGLTSGRRLRANISRTPMSAPPKCATCPTLAPAIARPPA